MSKTIKYRAGYKYTLVEDYKVSTPIVGLSIRHEYFTLAKNGMLTIRKGFAWDGASGPTFDTQTSMRPSLVHDVFCQAMRSRLLDYDIWQDKVNALFRQHCIEDGMWAWRAKLWHAAVELAKAGDPSQGESNPVKQAPC